MQQFISAASGEALSRPVLPLPSREMLCYEDGKPHIPAGYYWNVDKEFFTGTKGKWVINIADILLRKLHHEVRRLSGCCGLDGCDGPNLVDSSGNEVGTERSDCWMPHCVILEPERVRLKMGEPAGTSNAGSRPVSGDSSAAGSPSLLGPRG